MSKIAIYPGTFDPITFGHIDVIKKSLKLFDKIVVGVSDESNKDYLFNSDENLEEKFTSFEDTEKTKDEEDDLEIPAFLRRQKK